MGGSSSGAQSAGGTPSRGGSGTNGGTLGEAGIAGSGEPSVGGTSGGVGGANGGTGGSTGGGGGTDATCSPPCMAPNQFCEGAECKCSSGYTPQCDTPVVVVDGGEDFSNVRRFTFDGSNVYWASSGTTTVSGLIQKAPIDGGAEPTTLAMLDNPRDVAVSAGNVYFGGGFDESTYGLRKVSTGGQGLERLTMAQGEQVAADATAVYFAYNDIVMVSLDGTSTTRLANEPVNKVLDLAVYENDVFWATSRAICFTSKR